MSSWGSSAGACSSCGWRRPRSASAPSCSPCWSSFRCGRSGWLTTGLLLWFQKLRSLVDAVLDRVVEGQPVALRPVVRELDAAYAALVATAAPLRRATFGRNSAQLTDLLAISAAARLYARSLAAQAESSEDDATQTEAAG